MQDDWLPIYQHHALGSLARQGYRHLSVYCLSCGHRQRMPLEKAIEIIGPDAGMCRLAKRLRCSRCAVQGAHVEPEEPPAYGTPDYAAWKEQRRRWLRYEIEKLG